MIARLIDAMPILGSTVIPALVLAWIRYILRPQGGTRWLGTQPLPVRDLCRRLEREWRAHPEWTDYRTSEWTVQPREAVTR